MSGGSQVGNGLSLSPSLKKIKPKILKNVLVAAGISLGMFTCDYTSAWELWKALRRFGKKQQLLA